LSNPINPINPINPTLSLLPDSVQIQTSKFDPDCGGDKVQFSKLDVYYSNNDKIITFIAEGTSSMAIDGTVSAKPSIYGSPELSSMVIREHFCFTFKGSGYYCSITVTPPNVIIESYHPFFSYEVLGILRLFYLISIDEDFRTYNSFTYG